MTIHTLKGTLIYWSVFFSEIKIKSVHIILNNSSGILNTYRCVLPKYTNIEQIL